MRQF
ncbi:unnamed protein product [Linum tenue]|jgi:diphthine-ammonia ligase